MNNLTPWWRFAVAATCCAASAAASAAGQASAGYAMPRDNINAGVRDTASANFQIARSSFGEVMSGSMANDCYRLSSGFAAGVGPTPAALNLLSVVSRKAHGMATYDITIDHNQTLCGRTPVEPRQRGSGWHTLVFRFDNAITSIGAVTALDKFMNTAGNPIAALFGGDVIVTLINGFDTTRFTVFLEGLNGSGKATTSIGLLAGDVNGSRAVTAADISAVKANKLNTLNVGTAKYDLNTDGAITSQDVTVVKSRAGLAIP